MIVIEDRHRHVVNGVAKQPGVPNPEISSSGAADTRRQWVAPMWERRDTPMEVTMYAGQR